MGLLRCKEEHVKNKIKVVDVLFWTGAAVVALGVGLWSVPGGIVTFGTFLLAASVLADFSGGEDT